MLIKGVTGGKERGNPIEYAPAEKFPLAIGKFLNQISPEGKMLIYDNKCTVDQHVIVPLAIPNGKGYANNSYKATGKVWYKTLDIAKDKLFPTKSSEFEIEFKDSLDNLGMPDIELVSLKLN